MMDTHLHGRVGALEARVKDLERRATGRMSDEVREEVHRFDRILHNGAHYVSGKAYESLHKAHQALHADFDRMAGRIRDELRPRMEAAERERDEWCDYAKRAEQDVEHWKRRYEELAMKPAQRVIDEVERERRRLDGTDATQG